MPESFNLRARIDSFKHAFRGVVVLVIGQHNARLHLLATVLVVVCGWYFSIAALEWTALLLAIGGVWMAEALNTAVEELADAVHPEQHPSIRNAKDVAAAAVLLFAVCALLVGLVIFVPYIIGSQVVA